MAVTSADHCAYIKSSVLKISALFQFTQAYTAYYMAVTNAWHRIKSWMLKHQISADINSENALQRLASTRVGILQAHKLCCPPGSQSHAFLYYLLFLSFPFLFLLFYSFLSVLFFSVPSVCTFAACQVLLSCRRTSQAAPKHSVPHSSKAQHVSLDSSLAAYLLALVGHVMERHSHSQAQQVLLASKAVAVYKLVAQVR